VIGSSKCFPHEKTRHSSSQSNSALSVYVEFEMNQAGSRQQIKEPRGTCSKCVAPRHTHTHSTAKPCVSGAQLFCVVCWCDASGC